MDVKITYDNCYSVTRSDSKKFYVAGYNPDYSNRAGYLYIINMIGTDFCNFGHASHIFDKINSELTHFANVIPNTEPNRAFQVYISKPVINRRQFVSELCEHFSDLKTNHFWYNCGFENAISALRELETPHICIPAFNHVQTLLTDAGYSAYCLYNKYWKFSYRKPLQIFKYDEFMSEHYSHLFDNNVRYLSDNVTSSDLKDALSHYLDYIISSRDAIRAESNLPSKKSYSAYVQAKNCVEDFIKELDTL